MCGIAGFWRRDGGRPDAEVVAALSAAIMHRGPDGEGAWTDDEAGISLAHRRLAILDLTASGVQPMVDPESGLRIVYNGEVYNFVELRGELEARNCRFRSTSDTEVVLLAYREWGVDCLRRLNGMFAFALWDPRSTELFLARDRFGVKPLYYRIDGEQLAFASELQAFARVRGHSLRVDDEILTRSVAGRFGVDVDETTLIRTVRRVLPGHFVRIGRSRVEAVRWWRTLDNVPEAPKGDTARVQRFRELFDDACRIRLRSDVRVVTCLSGGMDSSSILFTLARNRTAWANGASQRISGGPQRAVIASAEGTAFDETAFATAAAEAAGAEVTLAKVDPFSWTGKADAIIQAADGIEFNFPAFIWDTYRACRQEAGGTVTLDGHGGDEILGGYPQHVEAALTEVGGLFSPRRIHQLLQTLQGMLSAESQWSRSSTRALLLDATFGPNAMRRQLKKVVPKAWLSRRSAPSAWLQVPVAPRSETPWEADMESLGPFQTALYRDVHVTVLPALLRVFDRMSMAHGVEVRHPFLDWRLVTYLFALPMEMLLRDGYSKWVLREAMKGTVPDETRRRRRKVGFSSPMQLWLNGLGREWILDVMRSREFLGSPVWSGERIAAFAEERLGSRSLSYEDAERIWPYVCASRYVSGLGISP